MTIKTTLHRFSFDTSNAAGMQAWLDLRTKLAAMGLHMMESWSGVRAIGAHHDTALRFTGHGNSGAIELETEHLFSDQWNAAPLREGENGYRVFDWAVDYRPTVGRSETPHPMKTGYWLEPTDEMVAIRAQTLKCGFCGAQHAAATAPADLFCDKCLDSPYLKRTDLPLLRLFQAGTPFGVQRAELDEAEAAVLVPRWMAAQVHGSTERGKARIAKARKDVTDKYDRAILNATQERDGRTWLLDHAPGLDENAIYYTHTGRWGFGWRTAVGADLLPEVKAQLADFPFPYDIKEA